MSEQEARHSLRGRRYLSQGLKVAVSIILLAVLLRGVDWRLILKELSGARLGWVALAWGLFIAGLALRAWRWDGLLVADGIHVPISVLIRWYFIGTFFNTMLPTGFGGDVVKTYVLARYSARPGAAAGSVLVDRFSGILALLLIGAVALLLAPGLATPLTAALIWLLVAGALSALVIMAQRGVRDWVRTHLPWLERVKLGRAVLDAIPAYGPRPLLRALAISFVFNMLLIGVNLCLARALGLNVPLPYFFIFIPLISVSLLLPSVGGLGVREMSYVALFGQAGVAPAAATALSLLYYAVMLGSGLLGGIFYFLPTSEPATATSVSRRK
ncbi:MAG: flippase-like domain-containing protein [Anaerolineae bacterium]|nr:flippase-like domain-containing protein [Anaerolineae bacterium]